MTGQEVYNEKYVHKIHTMIERNKDKEYLPGYYYYIKNNRIGLTSSYTYLAHVVSFMNDRQKSLRDLSLDDYTIYLGSLEGKTTSYQVAVYSALKHFSKYLYATKRNDSDPMVFVRKPKAIESQKTVQKRQIGYLNDEEIQEYINCVKTGVGSKGARTKQEHWRERDLAIIMIFLNTGLRCSALYKLNVSDIDFEKKTLITTDKESKVNEYELSDRVLGIISDWLKKREILLDGKAEDALFISYARERIGVQGISKIVTKYAAGIKGKHITPHKLRATYGTTLYKNTKDLVFVQNMMRHNSPKTTELYIRGQNSVYNKRAASIMDKATD